MALTWVGLSSLYVCFPDDIRKLDAAVITKLEIEVFHETHLFWVKRSQRLGWSSDRMQYCHCCCIYKLHWDFPAVMLRRTIVLATPGFPCVTSSCLLVAGCWVFLSVGFALL